MFCPKCGYPEVNSDECPKCGVYISKYLAVLVREKAGKAPDEAAGLWTVAYKLHYMEGDKDRALELYRKIVDSYPEYPEAGYAAQQITILEQPDINAEANATGAVQQELVADPTLCSLIPGRLAHKYRVMPINRTGNTLTIAMVDPSNTFARDDIKFMTGYNVEPVEASEAAVKAAIEKYYGPAQTTQDTPATPRQKEDGPRLIDCPDCGKEVSKRAAACPNCGCPVREIISSEQAGYPLPEINRTRVPECPACGSAQVEVISSSRMVGNVPLLRVIGSAKGKTYRCNDCRHEW